MEAILEVENLVKDYGNFRAVDGISFSVPRGKIVGFLGPNGAGKTTTIQILLGITLSTGGRIRYFGKDFSKNREECLQKINYTSAFNSLLGRISVFENLKVFAMLYGVKNPKKKILEMADYFEISHLMSQLYQNLSAGQKTRVHLIKSLINDPELILMDEPTASLDPDIADKTLSLIEDLNKTRNLAILYTSHDMDEITRVCNDVIFLDKGKIVAHDTPLNLTKMITGVSLRVVFIGQKGRLEEYLVKRGIKFQFVDDRTIEIETEEKMVAGIIVEINKLGLEVVDLEVNKPSLEDVFLQIARGGKDVV